MTAILNWNPPFTIALFALISAQLFKFLSTFILERRFDFARLTSMGGMPSSHSAAVAALSTAIGLEVGWGSGVFGVTAFLSMLIIYDATGIRQAASSQARLLNKMLDDLKAHHSIRGERVVESLGHTVLEVIVGTVYGILITFLLYP